MPVIGSLIPQALKGKTNYCLVPETSLPSKIWALLATHTVGRRVERKRKKTKKETSRMILQKMYRSEEQMIVDRRRDRTCNLLIRSQAPCHWASRPISCVFIGLNVSCPLLADEHSRWTSRNCFIRHRTLIVLGFWSFLRDPFASSRCHYREPVRITISH